MKDPIRASVVLFAVIAAVMHPAHADADMYPQNTEPGDRSLDASSRQDLWVLRNLGPVDQNDRILFGELTSMTPTQYRDSIEPEDFCARRPLVALQHKECDCTPYGLPVKMSAAEWYAKPNPRQGPAAKASALGVVTPIAVGLGIIVLGVIAWWMRRYT